MIDVREYGCVDEVAEKVGMSEQEIVDALSEGKTGLVYNQDYRWAEDERPCRYILLMHIETCINALKEYFSERNRMIKLNKEEIIKDSENLFSVFCVLGNVICSNKCLI